MLPVYTGSRLEENRSERKHHRLERCQLGYGHSHECGIFRTLGTRPETLCYENGEIKRG